MIAWDAIQKEMIAQKLRMVLTILAIAWGTLSIACMLAIGEGFRLSFNSAMQTAGVNLITATPGQSSLNYQGQSKGHKVFFPNNLLNKIKANFPNLVNCSAGNVFYPSLEYQNKKISAEVDAIFPAGESIKNINILPNGRLINPLDIQQKNRVIILSSDAAKKLFPNNQSPIGQQILLANYPFTIIGISQEKISIGMMDNNKNYIPYSTYLELTNNPKFDFIFLALNPTQDSKSVKADFTRFIAEQNGLNPKDDQLINYFDLAAMQKSTAQFFMALQIFLGALGGTTLLVASIGVANVMLISVKKATRLIGIQMAIGARTYHILLHYLIEALLVTMIGGIIGIMISAFFIEGLRYLPIHSKVWDLMGHPLPVLSWSVLLSVIGTFCIVGFLAGFFPALKAALIDPAEALRHE